MAAPSIALADLIVTGLNAEFSGQFTATRQYQPMHELGELETLQVAVVPAEQTDALETRSESKRELVIDIGIQKKVAAITNAILDPLMSLVEDVIAFFKTLRLSDYRWTLTENAPIYDPAHLRESLVFTSVVRVHFEVLL